MESLAFFLQLGAAVNPRECRNFWVPVHVLALVLVISINSFALIPCGLPVLLTLADLVGRDWEGGAAMHLVSSLILLNSGGYIVSPCLEMG